MSGDNRVTHLQVAVGIMACGKQVGKQRAHKVSYDFNQVTCESCQKQEKTMTGKGKYKCLTCGKPYRDHPKYWIHP